MPKEYETRETNKKEGTSTNFLLGALIGGLAGAAAALLFAPKAGKDLRKSINSQAGSLWEKTGQLQETVKVKGNGVLSKTSTFSKEMVSKVKNKPVAEEEEISYIPIGDSSEPIKSNLDSAEIRRRIEEAKKALDEEESKVGIRH